MYLLATASGSQVFLQNADSKFVIAPVSISSTASGCAFSPDGTLLAVAHSTSPSIAVYDTSTWAVMSEFLLPLTTSKGVSFGHTQTHRIRGTVRDKDGNLVSRTVRAHRRSDGALVAQTVSAAMTGEYEVLVYPDSPTEAYDVQFLAAPGELLNDLIYARTTTEPVS